MKNTQKTIKQLPVERKLLLLALSIGTLSGVLSVLLETFTLTSLNPKIIALVAITLVLATLLAIALLSHNFTVLTVIAHIILISSGLFLSSYFVSTLVNRNNVSLVAEMGTFSSWFFALYLLIFWIYGINLGKKVSFFFYCAIFIITLVFYFPFKINIDNIIEIRVLTSFFLANAVLILALANFKKRFDSQAAIAKEMELAAYTDILTGIGNRSYLQKEFLAELERAKRYGKFFSVALVDIDHFKSINDNYGHDVGDEVIKYVAHCLQAEIRGTDKVGRWGGEEFLLIFPELESNKTEVVCSRIRKIISEHKFKDPINKNITVSIGVATWQNQDVVDSLTKRADMALYRAKREGRNRVIALEG